MPDEEKSHLSKILSLLIDEIDGLKKLASLEAIQSEAKEDWPELADVEGAYVGRVLYHTKGNKQAAARILNVDRKTLDRMIRRHNLTATFQSGNASS